jgi:hypothetical protein
LVAKACISRREKQCSARHRFPDIPSLPPPPSQRKKDDVEDSSPLQHPPAVHTHLTDSECDEGLHDSEDQDPETPRDLPRVPAEQDEHPLQPPPAHMRTAPPVARATVVHATAAPDPLALGQASPTHTGRHAPLSLNSLRSAMPESEGRSPLHGGPAGSSIGGGRDSEGGKELREREITRSNRAASVISPARVRPPVAAPAPNATPRERESAVSRRTALVLCCCSGCLFLLLSCSCSHACSSCCSSVPQDFLVECVWVAKDVGARSS